jgi:hypothetical protein
MTNNALHILIMSVLCLLYHNPVCFAWEYICRIFDHQGNNKLSIMFLILLIQRGGVLENYLPIVVFIFLGIAFGIVPMLIGYWLGPSKPERANTAKNIMPLSFANPYSS